MQLRVKNGEYVSVNLIWFRSLGLWIEGSLLKLWDLPQNLRFEILHLLFVDPYVSVSDIFHIACQPNYLSRRKAIYHKVKRIIKDGSDVHSANLTNLTLALKAFVAWAA